MKKETLLNKEYKTMNAFIKKIESELEAHCLDDYLQQIQENGKSIEENLREGKDFCNSFKDKDGGFSMDFRVQNFIYIYSKW